MPLPDHGQLTIAEPNLTAPPTAAEAPGLQGTPAPYGRACTNCARAKCRCILKDNQTPCERCTRLRKECRPKLGKRWPARAKKGKMAARTAKLENKVENLLTMLRNSGVPDADMHKHTHTHAHTLVTNVNGSISHHPSPGQPALASMTPVVPTPTTLAASTVPSALGPHFLPGHLDAVEKHLRRFRVDYLSNFPFLHLPHALKAAELKRDRPFLWSCILTITARSVTQQKSAFQKVKQQIAERVIMELERSLDILQGLLVMLAWPTYLTIVDRKTFLCLFANLAGTIIGDLYLNKTMPEENTLNMNFNCIPVKAPPQRHRGHEPRTMDERRAFLSWVFLTASISDSLGKIDVPRWKPYMDECLRVVEQDQGTPNNATFVVFVRLQGLVFQASEAAAKEGARDAGYAPVHMHIKGLLAQLEQLRTSVRSEACTNAVLNAHLLHAELRINSLGLFGLPSPGVQVPYQLHSFRRIDQLVSCLQLVRAWLDSMLAIPLADWITLPFSMYMQLSHIFVILHALTTFDDPAWDRATVSKTVDLLPMLDVFIEKLAATSVAAGVVVDSELDGVVWVRAAKMLKNTRDCWASQLAEAAHGNTGRPTTGEGGVGDVDLFSIDLWDAIWAGDIVNLDLMDLYF